MTKDGPDEQSEAMTAASPDDTQERGTFPVVGVGASAGGIEALSQLMKVLPADTGMAFVLVQHLAPSHPSALAEILQRLTEMAVREVQDEPAVLPNNVYVIPPGRSMIIAGGKLQLLPREGRGAHRPIDQFFRSLSEERRHQAIGVVLSGTATDGTLGLEAIKGEGGITFAQDASAQYEGMPHSAIASGAVDFVLSPEGIANEIVRISQHPYSVPAPGPGRLDEEPSFAQILKLLHHSTGVDFNHYKRNTLYRRITRRMVLQKTTSLGEYVRVLQQTPAEMEALYQDILINVTSFFRDPGAFEALKSVVFPRLVKDRSAHDPVRIWTLGCSQGQEAYSVAMCYAEFSELSGNPVPLQLFATDLNANGIEIARTGIYPKDIAQDVSPERLRRFFAEVDGTYRISKQIRDVCVFSRHNVLSDPPFSRIDVITCRNLLIYLEPVLQQKILPTLHYALKPHGFLWLGSSETIGSHRNLFEAEDLKHKIYLKKPGPSPSLGHFPLQHGGLPRAVHHVDVAPAAGRGGPAARGRPHAGDQVRAPERARLGRPRHPPVSGRDWSLSRTRGGPRELEPPQDASGRARRRGALGRHARRQGRRAGARGAPAGQVQRRVPRGVRRGHPRQDRTPERRRLPHPLRGWRPRSCGREEGFRHGEGYGGPRRGPRQCAPRPGALRDARVPAIRHRAARGRERGAPVGERGGAVRQRGAAEHQRRAGDLEGGDPVQQRGAGDGQRRAEQPQRRAQPTEQRPREPHRERADGHRHAGAGPAGPPLHADGGEAAQHDRRRRGPADRRHQAEPREPLGPGAVVMEVLDTVNAREREVRDKNGRWHLLRIRPYRTLDNRIDGVVMVLVDVDALKQSHAELRAHAEELARFNSIAVGRELRMIELKKEVNELCQQLGLPARYPLDFEGES